MRLNPRLFKVAGELLSKHGWVQGYYGLPNGYCVVGACGEAMRKLGLGSGTSEFEQSSYFMPLREAVDAIGGINQMTDHEVYRWNDTKGRTLDEVLNVLEEAGSIAARRP
jgi:hypothetical protein